MGDPKKKHKTFNTPKRPYETEALMEELRTIGAYGLRNKTGAMENPHRAKS